MDDVAREMGISKKTLYQYIADKDDLVGNLSTRDCNRARGICKCFGIGLNAIEELYEISFS